MQAGFAMTCVQICTEALSYEDLSGLCEIINALPEGIRLARFPEHCEGPQCWCRPRVIWLVPGDTEVRHKDLANGEFDC